MKTNLEKFRKDLDLLVAQGINLLNAMNVEQYPKNMETHFQTVLKKDFAEFTRTLPSFVNVYQSWYSEAQIIIKLFLPDRLEDFKSLYESPKMRKEVKQENYVIEDYLKNLIITQGFEKKIIAGPTDAIAQFQQQLNILNSVSKRFESTLYDIERLVTSQIFDAELESAMELAKNKLYRAAGAISGVVLEKHLRQVLDGHKLKLNKKSPKISDYNDFLKKNEVYDFEQWRFIQILGEIRDLCYQNKKREPTPDEIVDIIEGVDKVIKTIF